MWTKSLIWSSKINKVLLQFRFDYMRSGSPFHQIVKANIAGLIWLPCGLLALFPKEQRYLFVVRSKLVELFFTLEIFDIILQTKFRVVHYFLNIGKVVRWFRNLFIRYYLIHRNIQIFVLLIYLFKFLLIVLRLFYQFLHLFITSLANIHDALLLLLEILKVDSNSIAIEFASITRC